MLRAFEDARQQAYRYWADHRCSYLAWFSAEQEGERALLGPDPWSYSIEYYRVALETLLRLRFDDCTKYEHAVFRLVLCADCRNHLHKH